MNLIGKKVKLRAIEKSDLGLLLDMFNDPEIEGLVVGYSFPLSMYEEEKWFENLSSTSNDIRLIIETEEDGAVGYTSLVNINWKNRSAVYSIKIANKHFRAKGIGTDTVMTIMKYAFEELNLHRLETGILDCNEGSEKLFLRKCGWKNEGIKRAAVFKNNRYHDITLVSILRADYDSL